MRCCECDREVDPNQPGVYRQVSGWEKVRFGGGANQILFRHLTGKLMCATCGEASRTRAKLHISEGQGSLI